MNASIAPRAKSPSYVRAMPGRCPVPLPHSLGDVPNELELVSWCLSVRDWGLGQTANGRPMLITVEGIVNWVPSLVVDWDLSRTIQEMIMRVLPEDF